jgi:hypothetical protein
VLFRLVDVGAELFAMAAVCAHARQLLSENPSERGPEQVADLFCRGARRRIARSFRDVFRNDDNVKYRAAVAVLEGRHAWLEDGLPQ